ncbi:MAG: hypothetical protein RLZ42_1236 [Armatimonadota bacterium]
MVPTAEGLPRSSGPAVKLHVSWGGVGVRLGRYVNGRAGYYPDIHAGSVFE